MAGETSDQHVKEQYSEGRSEDNGTSGGQRRRGGGLAKESNSCCMLVPTCLNFKLQEVFTINSMLLNVFSGPKVYLSKVLTKDKKQGSFMLN